MVSHCYSMSLFFCINITVIPYIIGIIPYIIVNVPVQFNFPIISQHFPMIFSFSQSSICAQNPPSCWQFRTANPSENGASAVCVKSGDPHQWSFVHENHRKIISICEPHGAGIFTIKFTIIYLQTHPNIWNISCIIIRYI